MEDYNGWQSFKRDFNGVCSTLFWSVAVLVGVIWYFGLVKVSCLGKVCGVILP